MTLTEIVDNPELWKTGAVTFVDWQRVPWAARVVGGVTGQVAVVASEDALGFTMRGGDHANWIALVTGPSGTVHVIPGCKVLSITLSDEIKSDEYEAVP